MKQQSEIAYGEEVAWSPVRPRLSAPRVVLSWLVAAASLMVAAWLIPGADVNGFSGALVAALVIAILNALLPPLIAALRLPFMLLIGFALILVLDALMLVAADNITDGDIRSTRSGQPSWLRSSLRHSASSSMSCSGPTMTTPTRSA